jgi:hypothetical protein
VIVTPIVPKTRQNLERLRALVADAEALAPTDRNRWLERARLAITAIYGADSPELRRFEKIRYTLPVATDRTPRSAFEQAIRSGLSKAVAAIEAMIEDVEASVSDPALSAPGVEGLHPWVSEPAARLWNDGYRRQAVQAAATLIEASLKSKLGVFDANFVTLVNAFASGAPTERLPRLRLDDVGPESSDSWKNAHDGAAAFGRGCAMRIRNLYTHEGNESEQQDLEALCALSLLARWVEQADVVRAE